MEWLRERKVILPALTTLESLVRFDLQEQDGVTTVRLTHSGLTSDSARAHHQGWPQVLGWLQAYAEK